MRKEHNIIDKLESNLLEEAVRNKHHFLKAEYNEKEVSTYFKHFLLKKCIKEFKQEILNELRHADPFDKTRYFKLNLDQFEQKIPSKRKHKIEQAYKQKIMLSENPLINLNDSIQLVISKDPLPVLEQPYFDTIIKVYEFCFPNFIEMIKQLQKNDDEGILFDEPEKSSNKPLDTNLTVPQLALLFRMLTELKPDLFIESVKADLFRYMSLNFHTKDVKDKSISTESLRKKFNNPAREDIAFWQKHLITLQGFLRNELNK